MADSLAEPQWFGLPKIIEKSYGHTSLAHYGRHPQDPPTDREDGTGIQEPICNRWSQAGGREEGSSRPGSNAADHRGGLYRLSGHRPGAAGAPASCAPGPWPRHLRGPPGRRRAVWRVAAVPVLPF